MENAVNRFRLMLDMYEVGEHMQRQRLRRKHPDETEDQIATRMRAWRHDRPGASGGDCPGGPSRRFG